MNYQSLQRFLSSHETSRAESFQFSCEAWRPPGLLSRRDRSFFRFSARCWREQPQNKSCVIHPQLCSTCWYNFKLWYLSIPMLLWRQWKSNTEHYICLLHLPVTILLRTSKRKRSSGLFFLKPP